MAGLVPAGANGALTWNNCALIDALAPMIEPLLCGIVLGLIPVTLLGLFVAAWNQYRRGSLLDG
jgi:cytochrome b6-f complex subunit 5